jgi:hypothetical protein
VEKSFQLLFLQPFLDPGLLTTIHCRTLVALAFYLFILNPEISKNIALKRKIKL